jgi:DNA-binding transcriptional regulator GbsR (MarR family)
MVSRFTRAARSAGTSAAGGFSRGGAVGAGGVHRACGAGAVAGAPPPGPGSEQPATSRTRAAPAERRRETHERTIGGCFLLERRPGPTAPLPRRIQYCLNGLNESKLRPVNGRRGFLHSSIVGRGEFIEQVGVFFEAEGLSRTAGRIFGRLLLSEASLSLDQLAADLGASKAGISTETRMLERRGVLERVRHPGDRRVYYQVAPDLPVPTLELRLDRMRRFSLLVAKARREIRHPSPVVRRRLADMAESYRYVLTALGTALDRWHAERPAGRGRVGRAPVRS